MKTSHLDQIDVANFVSRFIGNPARPERSASFAAFPVLKKSRNLEVLHVGFFDIDVS